MVAGGGGGVWGISPVRTDPDLVQAYVVQN